MNPADELKRLAVEIEAAEYEEKLEVGLSPQDAKLLQILKSLQPFEQDLMKVIERASNDTATQLYDIEQQLGMNIKDLFAQARKLSWPKSEIPHVEDMVEDGNISAAINLIYSEMEEKLGLA